MASKCPVCSRQKGKRACPALDKIICPRCCFQERARGLNCPETCIYLQKSRMVERQKEVVANQTYYDGLMREFARDPELYAPFLNTVASSVVELTKKDNFIEDAHVVEALQKVFAYHRTRLEGKETERETLLNRIGVLITGIEETILKFKIDNKAFDDKHVVIGLNQLNRMAEMEKTENIDPRHFIKKLKELVGGDRGQEPGAADRIIIPGSRS